MASTACFLHTCAPSTSKSRLSLVAAAVRPSSTQIACVRAQKQQQQQSAPVEDGTASVSRRLALTLLAGAAAVGAKVSPADAAYGEAANVFGKQKKNTDFAEYKGDGFKLLIPSKWNPSKEREFPGQVLRFEDNGDAVSNLAVMIIDCGKTSITDYGTPEEFLGQFDFLLGKQVFSGKTDSEGGFDTSSVATANLLEASTPVIDGTQYYSISVLTRTADGDEGGRHQIITAAVKDKKLYICKAQAGDKRWFKGAKKFVESAASSFNVA